MASDNFLLAELSDSKAPRRRLKIRGLQPCEAPLRALLLGNVNQFESRLLGPNWEILKDAGVVWPMAASRANRADDPVHPIQLLPRWLVRELEFDSELAAAETATARRVHAPVAQLPAPVAQLPAPVAVQPTSPVAQPAPVHLMPMVPVVVMHPGYYGMPVPRRVATPPPVAPEQTPEQTSEPRRMGQTAGTRLTLAEKRQRLQARAAEVASLGGQLIGRLDEEQLAFTMRRAIEISTGSNMPSIKNAFTVYRQLGEELRWLRSHLAATL